VVMDDYQFAFATQPLLSLTQPLLSLPLFYLNRIFFVRAPLIEVVN
jgi:hypothetical protein